MEEEIPVSYHTKTPFKNSLVCAGSLSLGRTVGVQNMLAEFQNKQWLVEMVTAVMLSSTTCAPPHSWLWAFLHSWALCIVHGFHPFRAPVGRRLPFGFKFGSTSG